MHKKIPVSRRIRYSLEYALARTFFFIFRVLGRKRASNLGGWLGRKIGPLLTAHKTAVENISAALPELDLEERDRVLKKMWDNLGRNAAEIPFVRDLKFSEDDVRLVGQEYLDEFVASGQSAIFVTAHYGPWEATALAGKYCNVDVNIVYRAANNPLVENYFQQERKGVGYEFVPKGKSGARSLIKAIKENRPIALLNDQKQNSGVPIPFFGRDAMTATAIADFACKLKLPVYPIRAERTEGGQMQVTVYPAIYAPTDGDTQKNVVSFLTTINEIYEDWIRERPDHWFWVHNRW
ncbi:lysophospholipid acyltransferase family protein [Sneathiella glossodoripedis]|uniref:lysophospholipid acyltransferase family protein n=1 Tax=Sneathiella glossodoripedis TaxID=418853 RepID=UPI00056B8363|nr:lysophospholipid acyltransferase family protein [Sneathiella glossodoripedis]